MPNNYILLEKIVVGSAGASSVTFANIPQTGYTDLVVKASVKYSTASVGLLYISFNGSSSSFTGLYLQGNGTSAASASLARYIGAINGSDYTANTFSNSEIYIPNYTSGSNKSFSSDSVTENNATPSYQNLNAGLWSNTSAINQVTLTPDTGSFVANSTFYLYGVAKLGTTPTIAPKATGGDVIDTDGTYWYHIFRSSGTFTPAVALTTDYLVVAGGGGGGSYAGGGGGAGGYRTANGYSLASGTNYTVTIGAGGAGNTGLSGSNGSNSVFDSITSTGGGGGGGFAFGVNGLAGGSGGGASAPNANSATGGAASPSGQGSAGGSVSNSGVGAAAGGGGASAAGGSSTSSVVAGAGGAGTASSISGTSVTYAGGGGGSADPQSGGAGGAGGGGAGVTSSTANPGTANTGGGGGGRWNPSAAGGTGGSGIVVVRYLVA